ncbi:MAG TPA: peptidyl-prolyl cis-trans isomerase [Pyrinomonadaceae bacterium]|nr:peptidyl-prolyl cis-trans isomerase [Pyrinomonadaceae bacterium]
MRVKSLSVAIMLLFAIVLFGVSSLTAVAQEGEQQVVDEVVAQVNDDVITLSRLKRETRERIEALKQNGMTEQQALAEAAKKQPELIAILINEQLLLQKGKELELANEIEAAVNSRMLEIAREQGITTIEKLDAALRESKLDPVQIRATMRAEMMKQAVFQQEVDRRVFFGFSTEEVKKYFEAHKDKFRKPESITLSELWLSTTNKDDAAVKARASELVAQLRAGADFAALAASNSEREKNGQRTAPQDKGRVGTFEVPSLREDIAAAVKDIKVGGVTDPIKVGEGYQILRVDERTAAGTAPTFNDNQVREAMMIERQPKEREAFLAKLRNEAFIKLSDTYRASVEPLLKLTPPASAKSTEKTDKKKN